MREIGKLERFLGPDNYRILKGLVKTPASRIGFFLVFFFAMIAIFAPLIISPVPPNDAYKIPRDGYKNDPRPPGSPWKRQVPEMPFWYKTLTGKDEWVHLMGTSEGSYDIFYGVIWGTRTAFTTGLVVTVATFLIGVIYGSISAYYGGIVDNLMMRVLDVLMILPSTLAALILAAVLTPKIGKSVLPVMIALIAFGWMGYARIIRGDILSIKERDYIMAARVSGVKNSRILFKHIIPNAIFPTLVLASLGIGDVVLSFAALSFLGIGTETGYADVGAVAQFCAQLDQQPGRILVYRGIPRYDLGSVCDGLEPDRRRDAGCARPAYAGQVVGKLVLGLFERKDYSPSVFYLKRLSGVWV